MINNRDLSWLTFNERVLQEAQDKSVPLMQRLRFLGIFSNNQDEYIKVRIANIVRLSQIRAKNAPLLSGGYTAKELLPLINSQVSEGQKKFMQTYIDVLSEMEKHNIYVVNEKKLNQKQKTVLSRIFLQCCQPASCSTYNS